ncbi:conserved exported hypothetical protein [Syntrophobacter sp. SbD1]|nr:conserved exported hypothetical protein [Syntrophobacter sp. SbD1]
MKLKKLWSILLFILLGAITSALWRSQVDHEHEMILRHVEGAAEIASIRIAGVVDGRMAALELLADRWVDKYPPDFSRERFVSFAEAVFERYPSFSGIYWADPDGYIRFDYQPGEDSDRLGKRIQYSPGSAISPCFDLAAGEKGFQIVLPLRFEGKLQGYLSGEFKVAQIINFALPSSVIKDFVVSVYEGDQSIFQHGVQRDHGHEIYSKREIEIGGRKWSLKMNLGPGIYSTGSHWIFLFMVFGILLSASLSMLFYLLLQRLEAYRTSRDLALSEVTERKRVEVILQDKEKRLKDLVSELSTKNSELESFIYTISHDLKTPIVTIGGFIGALREDFGLAIPKEAERYLDYMSAASRKMEALINDLLDLSRVGRLVGKRAKVPLGEIVREALETLKPNIESRCIEVDVQENLPEVYCEKKRLGQVLYNLLGNAIKYIGKDNHAPRIDIGAVEQNGQPVFFVRDNGIGIEEKFFDKIFHIFERLPSAAKEEGTGIGLTIVKRIIEYHGGSVWLTSEPGRGSTFFFTIDDKES